MLLWPKTRQGFVRALGLAHLHLSFEHVHALLCVPCKVEHGWLVIELSHFLVLAVYEVAVEEYLHDCTTLILCHVIKYIASEQRQLLDSDELVEDSHD